MISFSKIECYRFSMNNEAVWWQTLASIIFEQRKKKTKPCVQHVRISSTIFYVEYNNWQKIRKSWYVLLLLCEFNEGFIDKLLRFFCFGDFHRGHRQLAISKKDSDQHVRSFFLRPFLTIAVRPTIDILCKQTNGLNRPTTSDARLFNVKKYEAKNQYLPRR